MCMSKVCQKFNAYYFSTLHLVCIHTMDAKKQNHSFPLVKKDDQAPSPPPTQITRPLSSQLVFPLFSGCCEFIPRVHDLPLGLIQHERRQLVVWQHNVAHLLPPWVTGWLGFFRGGLAPAASDHESCIDLLGRIHELQDNSYSCH